MNKLLFILIAVAFGGAVGSRSLHEPALGGGAGVYKAPAQVSVCNLGDKC